MSILEFKANSLITQGFPDAPHVSSKKSVRSMAANIDQHNTPSVRTKHVKSFPYSNEILRAC